MLETQRKLLSVFIKATLLMKSYFISSNLAWWKRNVPAPAPVHCNDAPKSNRAKHNCAIPKRAGSQNSDARFRRTPAQRTVPKARQTLPLFNPTMNGSFSIQRTKQGTGNHGNGQPWSLAFLRFVPDVRCFSLFLVGFLFTQEQTSSDVCEILSKAAVNDCAFGRRGKIPFF